MRSVSTMSISRRKIEARKLTALELFAGAGGLGMGISIAGFETKAVIELDRYCCDTIRENQRAQHPILKSWPLISDDVRNIRFESYQNKIDLISGGPPCQPFSLGGKHRAHKDARDLWPEAVRAIRQANPRAFVFENVKGLTRQAFANYYEYIYLQLTYPEIRCKKDESWTKHLSRLEQHHTGRKSESGLSYRVVRRVLNAANYGVAQKRERVFFVGFRNDLAHEWHYPEETHTLDALIWDQVKTGEYWERHKVPKRLRTISSKARLRAEKLAERPDTQPWRTVRDAIVGLPSPNANGSKSILNHRLQLGARSYPGHTGSPLDEPAKTLKAGVHGVPGGENTIAFSNGDIRYLTIRESARLQTFPDDFIFHGSWSETMRQLGNAVPVQLAAQVAGSILEHLNGGQKPR
jgi:DNA (cytosine-5)-methyltransferase 1